MGRADAGATNVFERLFKLIRIGFALCQVSLHAQPCQRRFELVRSVGQKTFLRCQRYLQAAEQIVDGRHQRRDFFRHGGIIQRAHVVRFAGTNALFELRQRFDATHQRQPDQQHRQRQRHKLRHHGAFDDFSGQCLAFFKRLGYLHQYGLCGGFA